MNELYKAHHHSSFAMRHPDNKSLSRKPSYSRFLRRNADDYVQKEINDSDL